jgi:hypothetical protein
MVGAMESSDLSESDNLDDMSDIDVIRAMGMAGARNPLGAALWRLKFTQDGSVAHDVVQMLEGELRRSKWGPVINWQDARKVVMQVLDHYIDGNCRACGGKGHLPGTNVQTLMDEDCGYCHGTGQRELPKMPGRDEAARWLRGLIDQKEYETGAAVGRRLSSQLGLW